MSLTSQQIIGPWALRFRAGLFLAQHGTTVMEHAPAHKFEEGELTKALQDVFQTNPPGWQGNLGIAACTSVLGCPTFTLFPGIDASRPPSQAQYHSLCYQPLGAAPSGYAEKIPFLVYYTTSCGSKKDTLGGVRTDHFSPGFLQQPHEHADLARQLKLLNFMPHPEGADLSSAPGPAHNGQLTPEQQQEADLLAERIITKLKQGSRQQQTRPRPQPAQRATPCKRARPSARQTLLAQTATRAGINLKPSKKGRPSHD